MSFKKFIILLLILFLADCQEEFNRDYPQVFTHPPDKIILDLGATFHGDARNTTNDKIIAHGFKWSYAETLASKIEHTINLGEFDGGPFSADIRSALPNRKQVKVRAYVETSVVTVYGEELEFSSMGNEGPFVTSISPKTLRPFDTLTIRGKNFVSSPMKLNFNSNGISANTIGVNDSVAKAVIPYNLQGTLITWLILADKRKDIQGNITVVVPWWIQKGNFPGQGRNAPVSFSIGNLGYMGTGSNLGGYLSDFWQYNPTNDLWTQLPNFPGGARNYASSFVINGKAYVGLGRNPQSLDDLWEFDPQTTGWTQKASYPGGKRYEAMSFTIGSKGFFGGGVNASGNPSYDFWAYEPTNNTWMSKAQIPTVSPSSPANFAFKSGGYYYGGPQNAMLLCSYNDITDTWKTENSKINIGTIFSSFGFKSLTFENAVYIMGTDGYKVIPDINSIIKFPYPYSAYSTFSFVIGANGYYGLGTRTQGLGSGKEVFEFDPSK